MIRAACGARIWRGCCNLRQLSSRLLFLVPRLLTLSKIRQRTPTLGRSLRETFGFRIAGVLEGAFRTFGSLSICFCRMQHD